MIIERNKVQMKQLQLDTMRGYYVRFLNAHDVSNDDLLKERDYVCEYALSKGYTFIVYYKSKNDPLDCGVYIAPIVTYKNLLNCFLRPEDEYFVYNKDNNTWEQKNYTKEQFPLKEQMTLDNYRTFWRD